MNAPKHRAEVADALNGATNIRITEEFRAIFAHPPAYTLTHDTPQPTPDSYGPARRSQSEAQSDHHPRSEESHAWLIGIQSRLITEWVTITNDQEK